MIESVYCEDSYACMNRFCQFKHGNDWSARQTFNRYVETSLSPCKFGTNCTNPVCSDSYSHSTNWSVTDASRKACTIKWNQSIALAKRGETGKSDEKFQEATYWHDIRVLQEQGVMVI